MSGPNTFDHFTPIGFMIMSVSSAYAWSKARSLVSNQWLSDGEELRTFTPSTYGNYKSEIRRYPPFAWKIVQALGWSAMKLLFPLPLLAAERPSWRAQKRFEGEPPPAIAFGPGPKCQAAEILGLGPRDKGLWVLSKQRFGFGAIVTESVALPSDKMKNAACDKLDIRIDVPATKFTFEGTVTRKIARQEATYFRIRFEDGSGIDVLSVRHSRLRRMSSEARQLKTAGVNC